MEEQLGYFARKLQRRQYDAFRAKGYFIGSGVVEAGGKTVIGVRCKPSGMLWSQPGAENVLALRCNSSSRAWPVLETRDQINTPNARTLPRSA